MYNDCAEFDQLSYGISLVRFHIIAHMIIKKDYDYNLLYSFNQHKNIIISQLYKIHKENPIQFNKRTSFGKNYFFMLKDF